MGPITNIYGSFGSYNKSNEYLWLLQSITNFYEILLDSLLLRVIEFNQEFAYYLIKKLLS